MTTREGANNKIYINVNLDGNVEDFYGITFDLVLPPNSVSTNPRNGLLNNNAVSFSLATETWFAESPRDKRHVVNVSTNEEGETTASVAVSRIDGNPASGQGSIGQFVIITEKIELYRTTGSSFEVKNVMAVRPDLSVIPVGIAK